MENFKEKEWYIKWQEKRNKMLKNESDFLSVLIIQTEREINLNKARLLELVKQKTLIQKELHKDDEI
jgi:hypothetical protein